MATALAVSCSSSDDPSETTSDQSTGGVGADGGDGDCAAGETLCDGVCVVTASDPSNCGECGAACGAGQGCVEGSCLCAAGMTNCAGTCVDTVQDALNCGTCGVQCESGQLCQSGACVCQPGLVECSGVCTNTESDASNCGGCGIACPGGQVCAAGTCAGSCPTGQTQCGMDCVDLGVDSLNCGSCGNVCPSGQVCNDGSCGCPVGQTACGGACVSTSSDPSNCGSCGNACTGGQSCVNGTCVCASGQTLCAGTCTDTQTSTAHCGACNTACAAGQTCSAGVCVGGGSGGATGNGGSGSGGAGGSGTGGSGDGGSGTGGSGTGGGGAGGSGIGGSGDGGSGTGGSGDGGSGTGGSGDGGSGTGGSGTGGSTPGCGSINTNPFNCEFVWGAPSSGNNSSWLDFVSTWIGDETNGGLNSWSVSGTNNSCGDCNLVESVASTNSMVVFYTYFIGFQACHQGGYCDCNTDSGENLCSHGAQFIRNNWDVIVRAYGEYARVVYERSPNKPVIWWLEGDFIQYSYDEQQSPLSYEELGSLAREITCAIKTNQPNAIVAMNHSPWISDEEFNGFWGSQPLDVLDMVWVQGAGDSGTLPNSWGQDTATFASLHSFTGRPIMAETSYGLPDRWSDTSASNINSRISEGVIAVHVNETPGNYQSAIESLSPQLNSTCQ